ncbi:hypothetical protein MHU86_16319 [Fragilaria crotonensis]|nr:hypothetical protein MHU86_16319 [Fragilaria crotonensis]
MQSGKKLPKWEVRSRMGVYLGMSMQHARSVALVLNLKTGHVSPQFHVTFDPKFETVRHSLGNLSPPSDWQKLCGFKASSTSRLQDIKQPAQAQGLQQGVPFMEFDLEPGESVNEGEAQASQTPLPVSEGEQDQEPQVQLRRSPRLNKTSDEPSNKPESKVLMFGTTWKPSWRTSFLIMWPLKLSRSGWTLRESSIPCWLSPPPQTPTPCTTMRP